MGENVTSIHKFVSKMKYIHERERVWRLKSKKKNMAGDPLFEKVLSKVRGHFRVRNTLFV